MAGPKNGFMAGRQLVTIFSSTGESVQVSRPNAIDLVRTSGYSWTREDAGKERVEGDGPADPTAITVIVYDLDGNPIEVSKNNARELVNRGTHRWTTNGVTEAEAARAVVEAADALAKAESMQTGSADAVSQTSEPTTQPESLKEEAERVSGNPDVAAYLDGFSLEALKTMATERYGEAIHHRASKETAISKIVELEEASQLAS